MKRRLDRPVGKSRLSVWPCLVLVLYMLIMGLYAAGRFDGNWAETDSATFTLYIRDLVNQGRLVPPSTPVYPNGYAYQAISTFIVSLTGLEVETLQQWIYPLFAALVVLPAWITYRELTGSPLGATLSTLLLFIQPEFLFVILRSSHEKFTRTLMLICLFLLARSISQRHSSRKAAVYIALFFFTTFAFITSNLLWANSFIFAIAIVYVLGAIVGKLKPNVKVWNNLLTNRFRYIIPVCLVLVYVFTFFVYPPARHNFLVLQNTWDGIAELFLAPQTESADIYVAYSYVSFGWVNLPTYLILSIANWIMLAASFVIWLRQGWNWVWHSTVPKNQAAWLLWLFYTAFAIQGALAVISDASGAFSSNLQLRLFPSFAMIAVAMIGAALAEWRPQRYARAISLGFAAALFCISILSLLKATNEPLFSNKWGFYHPGELVALQWGDTHLNATELWTEFDERLVVAYQMAIGSPANRFTSGISPSARDIMLSSVVRLRGRRIDQPLPVPPDALQVYDNGTAQLYHLRPRTPYQR